MRTLQDSDLQVKLEKSVFHAKKMEYLEYIILEEEIKMGPNKIYTLLKWPKPRNVSEIQFFLRFINFYRRLIKKYFRIIRRLTNPIKKNVP